MYSDIMAALQKVKDDPEANMEEITEELLLVFEERREVVNTAMVFAHAIFTRTDRAPKTERIKDAFELAKAFREEANEFKL